MDPYIWSAKTIHLIFILIKFQMFILQRSLYFNIFFVQGLITYEEIIKFLLFAITLSPEVFVTKFQLILQ
jgi:hypothetical protein